MKPGDAMKGGEFYTQICITCHGETGEGGLHGDAPSLVNKSLTAEAVVNIVTNGRNQMPPFGGSYTPDQINDLAAYIIQVLNGKKKE